MNKQKIKYATNEVVRIKNCKSCDKAFAREQRSKQRYCDECNEYRAEKAKKTLSPRIQPNLLKRMKDWRKGADTEYLKLSNRY